MNARAVLPYHHLPALSSSPKDIESPGTDPESHRAGHPFDRMAEAEVRMTKESTQDPASILVKSSMVSAIG